MRVLGEIPNPHCKITLFFWNQKYLVKFESGLCEQTFKIPELDVTDLESLKKSLTPELIDRITARFESMHGDVAELSSP